MMGALSAVSFLCVLILALAARAEICEMDVCRFKLIIERRRTMTHLTEDGTTWDMALNGSKFVVQYDAFNHERDSTLVGTQVAAEDVLTADGAHKYIIVVNQQFPGPTLEVMEGAQVIELYILSHNELRDT